MPQGKSLGGKRKKTGGRKRNMRIYNTLTKKKEEFIPLEEGKVKMYVCGPTVYNFIHIGNARPMIVFDTVRRYMEYKGYEVNYVSNFTDVDDKIIAKAVEEGVSAEEISSRYIKECKKDMADMNVKPATTHPLATQEIDGMIDMIQTLMDKGFAYEVNGTVYFRVKNFKEYGKLSHKNLEDLQSGFRSLQVSGENQKEDPLDFVLWKPKKEGEPFWVSPWSEGRPGWHIECSVMSKKYIGEEIDIHAGGEDLVFPHHENEIAQSECCNGKQFARYWMHNAFLNIDNRKMSKSLGNFFTVREIGEKYDLQVLRFFMLNAHYRSPLNFSAELMEASKNSLERIITCVEQLKHLLETAEKTEMTAEEKALEAEVLEYVKKYENSMEDDFNTADAIAAIFELVKFANTKANENSTAAFVQYLFDTIVHLSDVLGLIVNKEAEILDEEIEKLIEERQMARKEKNFKRADEIRDELAAMGIILKDTREGVQWKRA
jgi:cysteinyl-tRNA synthetase